MLPIVLPLVPIAAIAAITKFHLSGEKLTKYDSPKLPTTFNPDTPSKGARQVEAYLQKNFIAPAAASGSVSKKLSDKRKQFEEMGRKRKFDAFFKSDTAAFGNIEVPGEWTLVDGYDPDRRLLYIHGGAFTVGSPVSHRALTYNLAKRTGCAVFAIDYRLMPENPRMASVEDCRAAYRWILNNGPDGDGPAEKIAMAGDSAGGNLALALSNWIKTLGLRKPNAVIALSPTVDTTFSAPSVKTNFEKDTMLKPMAKPLVATPRPILLWAGWKANKMSPSSPVISPIFDDLSHLPPTLIQVSSDEMLYDDARRFTNKARAQGSEVELQSWAHMCHVFQIFDEMLPEARQALDEMAAFLRTHKVAK